MARPHFDLAIVICYLLDALLTIVLNGAAFEAGRPFNISASVKRVRSISRWSLREKS